MLFRGSPSVDPPHPVSSLSPLLPQWHTQGNDLKIQKCLKHSGASQALKARPLEEKRQVLMALISRILVLSYLSLVPVAIHSPQLAQTSFWESQTSVHADGQQTLGQRTSLRPLGSEEAKGARGE